MSLIDTVLSRRSIRHYEEKDIPINILDKILEAGRQAPSAGNRQPWHFIVLKDYEIKNRLSKGKWNKFVKDTPVTIVGCASEEGDMKKWSVVDTTIALQNMVVAAWAMGVGSCWIGDFKEEQVKLLLDIPNGWKVVSLLTLGYPAEQPKSRKKKTIEEIVSYEKFK